MMSGKLYYYTGLVLKFPWLHMPDGAVGVCHIFETREAAQAECDRINPTAKVEIFPVELYEAKEERA
jgi:hypothetical protein